MYVAINLDFLFTYDNCPSWVPVFLTVFGLKEEAREYVNRKEAEREEWDKTRWAIKKLEPGKSVDYWEGGED